MTRLLVSVRDRDEAAIALEAGAQLIDVKEPRRGSLGRAEAQTIRSVSALVAGRVPVSAALGELLEHPGSKSFSSVKYVKYAKLGMAACADVSNWEQMWADVLARLPATTTAVAVSYADWREARAPSPPQILHGAVRLGCQVVLVDTFHKSNGGLLDHMAPPELADFVEAARASGMLVVLAGSLCRRSVPRVLPLSPDYVAVRGAVCDGTREGRIRGDRIRDLLGLLNRGQACCCPDRAPATFSCSHAVARFPRKP
jgi:uncharacterized protein (UPF0264 family)